MKKKSGSTMSKEIVPKTERLTVSDAPGGGSGGGGGGVLVGSFSSSGGGASPPIPGNAGARDDADSICCTQLILLGTVEFVPREISLLFLHRVQAIQTKHTIIHKGQHEILSRGPKEAFLYSKILNLVLTDPYKLSLTNDTCANPKLSPN